MATEAARPGVAQRLDELARDERNQGLRPQNSTVLCPDGTTGLTCERTELGIMEGYLSALSHLVKAAGDGISPEVARVVEALLTEKTSIVEKLRGIVASDDELKLQVEHFAELEKRIAGALHQAGASHHLQRAAGALDTVSKRDVAEVRAMSKPPDIVKFAVDALLLLQCKFVGPVVPRICTLQLVDRDFLTDSFWASGRRELSSVMFYNDLCDLIHDGWHSINDETLELLEPYMRFNSDPARHWGPWEHRVLDLDIANRACTLASALCIIVEALAAYRAVPRSLHDLVGEARRESRRVSAMRKSIARRRSELRDMLHSAQGHEAPLLEELHGFAGDPGAGSEGAQASLARELAAAAAMPFTYTALVQRERMVFRALFPSVSISVSSASGDALTLRVDPGERVRSIKEQVSSQWQIPVTCQTLLLGEAELPDADVISDHIATLVGRELDADPLPMMLAVSYEDIFTKLAEGKGVEYAEAARALEQVAQNECERSFAAWAITVAGSSQFRGARLFGELQTANRTLADVIKHGGKIGRVHRLGLTMLQYTTCLVACTASVYSALFEERNDEVAASLLTELMIAMRKHSNMQTTRELAFKSLCKDGGSCLRRHLNDRLVTGREDAIVADTLAWILDRAGGAEVLRGQELFIDRLRFAMLNCIRSVNTFFNSRALKVATCLTSVGTEELIRAMLPACRSTYKKQRLEACRMLVQVFEEHEDDVTMALRAEIMLLMCNPRHRLQDTAAIELMFRALIKDGGSSLCSGLLLKLQDNLGDVVQVLDWLMSRDEGGVVLRNEVLCTDSVLAALLNRTRWCSQHDHGLIGSGTYQLQAQRVALRIFPGEHQRIAAAVFEACEDARFPVQSAGLRMAEQMARMGRAGVALELLERVPLTDMDRETKLGLLKTLREQELSPKVSERALENLRACSDADWPCVRRAATALLRLWACQA